MQDNLRFWACWQEDLKNGHDAGQEPHLSSNSAAQILFRWFMTCLKHLQLCENLRPLLQMRFHLLPNFAKRLRWEAWHIGQVIGKMLSGREKWNTTYLDRRVQFQRSHLRGVTKSPWKFLRSNCFQSTSINLSVIPDAFQRFVTSTYFDPWPMQFMAVRFATDVFFEWLHHFDSLSLQGSALWCPHFDPLLQCWNGGADDDWCCFILIVWKLMTMIVKKNGGHELNSIEMRLESCTYLGPSQKHPGVRPMSVRWIHWMPVVDPGHLRLSFDKVVDGVAGVTFWMCQLLLCWTLRLWPRSLAEDIAIAQLAAFGHAKQMDIIAIWCAYRYIPANPTILVPALSRYK